ncbi:MAG: hypothetical protein OXG25_15010 [Gammaproteobacteria bacterium]|nr:hypothetical protein [Gammaproteobacteria bacterium]
MRRTASLFLVFLVIVIVGAVSFVTFYLGTGFSKLTFDPERRRQPLVLLSFERFGSEHQSERYQQFQRSRATAFGNYEYGVVFEGSSWLSSDGNRRERWDRIAIESFPFTASFVNAVTDPAYTAIEDWFDEENFEEHGQFVGHVKLTQSFKKPVVILLSDTTADSQRRLIEVVNETLSPFSGHIAFATPVVKIGGNSELAINYFAFIEFNDAGEMMDWLVNTIRKSRFAQLRRHMDNLSLVVATPS